MEMFGVYTTLTIAVWLFDTLHIGLGPALARMISRAVVKEDRDREISVFSTAFIVTATLSTIAAIAAVLVFSFIPITTLFGEEYASVAPEMKSAIWIALAILFIQSVCSTAEMAHDGYQETRVNNSTGAMGSVLAAITLASGIWFFPSIAFLLIAVNGPIALAKLVNLIVLIKRRPWLLPAKKFFQRKLVKPLLGDGIRFSVTYLVSALVEYNLMVLLIGRFVGPAEVGVYQVMIQIHFGLNSIAYMYTGPLWPAVMDAKGRNDWSWIQRTTRKSQMGIFAFAVFCVTCMVVLGPWLLTLWVGERFYQEVGPAFQMNREALLAFGAYFAVHMSRHINQTIAVGLDLINFVCIVLIVEALLMLGTAMFLLSNGGTVTSLFTSMAVVIGICSAWLFAVAVRKTIRQKSADMELQDQRAATIKEL